IDGRADAGSIDVNLGSDQTRRSYFHEAVFDRDACAQTLKGAQMVIDGTRSDRAATGERHFRFSLTRQEQPGQVDRCPNLSCQLIRRLRLRKVRTVDVETPLRVDVN